MIVLIYIISIVFSSPTFAGRDTTLPPFARRMVLLTDDVQKQGYGGAAIHVSIYLNNISDVVQTGTLTMLPGSQVSGQLVGVSIMLSRWTYLCGGVGNGTGVASPADGSFANIPKPVSWSIPAGGVLTLDAGAALYTNSLPLGLPGNQVNLEFYPLLKIHVNEDSGGIIGTVTPNADGLQGGSLCGGYTAPPGANFTLPLDRTGNPIAINGGRAF